MFPSLSAVMIRCSSRKCWRDSVEISTPDSCKCAEISFGEHSTGGTDLNERLRRLELTRSQEVRCDRTLKRGHSFG